MMIAQQNHHPDAADAALDALLAREEISIVDGLLALPGISGDAPDADRWMQLVQQRLETRLAQRMRRIITDTP